MVDYAVAQGIVDPEKAWRRRLVYAASPPISSSVRQPIKAAISGAGRGIHQHVWPRSVQRDYFTELGYHGKTKAPGDNSPPSTLKSITTPATLHGRERGLELACGLGGEPNVSSTESLGTRNCPRRLSR